MQPPKGILGPRGGSKSLRGALREPRRPSRGRARRQASRQAGRYPPPLGIPSFAAIIAGLFFAAVVPDPRLSEVWGWRTGPAAVERRSFALPSCADESFEIVISLLFLATASQRRSEQRPRFAEGVPEGGAEEPAASPQVHGQGCFFLSFQPTSFMSRPHRCPPSQDGPRTPQGPPRRPPRGPGLGRNCSLIAKSVACHLSALWPNPWLEFRPRSQDSLPADMHRV